MRVIAGSARRLHLKVPAGMDTRPTADRIKETLFNIIQYDIPGCYFLDLYAGSGQIGLEALSRGASYAVFIEQNRAACDCIRENIEFTKFTKESRLLKMDVLSGLRMLEGKYRFDFIFLDPPYRSDYEAGVLSLLGNSGLLKEDGVIIIEAALGKDFSFAEELGYQRLREKNYKTNKHVFLAKAE